MGFKNVLVWLRSNLVELIFLVLVVLLLMAFRAWAATSQAKDFFEQHSLKGELATDDEILRVHEGLRGDTTMTAASGCIGFTGPGYTTSTVVQTFTLCNSQLGKTKVIPVRADSTPVPSLALLLYPCQSLRGHILVWLVDPQSI
jgi:type II secretion system GspH-like protein